MRQGAASAVNWVERRSGLDLDGDGDVGIKGSPTDVGPAEQSGTAASMGARDGAAGRSGAAASWRGGAIVV